VQGCSEYFGVCEFVEDNVGGFGCVKETRIGARDNGCDGEGVEGVGYNEATDTLHG